MRLKLKPPPPASGIHPVVLMPRPGSNGPHFKNNGDGESLSRKGAHPRQSVLSPCKAFQLPTHPLRGCCRPRCRCRLRCRAGSVRFRVGFAHEKNVRNESERQRCLEVDSPNWTALESFRLSCVWGEYLDLSPPISITPPSPPLSSVVCTEPSPSSFSLCEEHACSQ